MTGENVPFCRFVWKYILNDGNRQVTLAFWLLTFGTGAQNSVTYVGSLYTFYRDRAG